MENKCSHEGMSCEQAVKASVIASFLVTFFEPKPGTERLFPKPLDAGRVLNSTVEDVEFNLLTKGCKHEAD